MTTALALAPGVRRILAPNPSPLTGPGTNTYIVGSGSLAVIDPGPDLDRHLSAILAATLGERITHIIVTHAHRDHSGLAAKLARATGAPVLAFGRADSGMSPRMLALAGSVPSSGEGLDSDFTPDGSIADGDRIHGPEWELEALHTPGHLGGHMCLAMGKLLFSGDHVMGWASTIVSPPEGDMGDYMASLHRLEATAWTRLFPGHGDPVEDPPARIAGLILHRRQREAQVLDALAEGPATPALLTARIYHDTPSTLWPAAERNILAHLLDLAERSLVGATPLIGPKALYHRL